MWTAPRPLWPRPQLSGSNGYGSFDIDTAGAWTYTLGSAHDEFVVGTTYTDSLTVATADGTQQTITVSITGTNDAAVITGSSTASLTETDAVQSTSGSLAATDIDNSASFIAQSGVAGANGYGSFSIDTAGAWTYTLGNAHDEFLAGTTYTDSVTVATADGTQQTLTVTITGTNDAAVITGSSTCQPDGDRCGAKHQRQPQRQRCGQLRGLRSAVEHRRLQRLRQLRHRHRRCLDLHPGQCP